MIMYKLCIYIALFSLSRSVHATVEKLSRETIKQYAKQTGTEPIKQNRIMPENLKQELLAKQKHMMERTKPEIKSDFQAKTSITSQPDQIFNHNEKTAILKPKSIDIPSERSNFQTKITQSSLDLLTKSDSNRIEQNYAKFNSTDARYQEFKQELATILTKVNEYENNGKKTTSIKLDQSLNTAKTRTPLQKITAGLDVIGQTITQTFSLPLNYKNPYMSTTTDKYLLALKEQYKDIPEITDAMLRCYLRAWLDDPANKVRVKSSISQLFDYEQQTTPQDIVETKLDWPTDTDINNRSSQTAILYNFLQTIVEMHNNSTGHIPKEQMQGSWLHTAAKQGLTQASQAANQQIAQIGDALHTTGNIAFDLYQAPTDGIITYGDALVNNGVQGVFNTAKNLEPKEGQTRIGNLNEHAQVTQNKIFNQLVQSSTKLLDSSLKASLESGTPEKPLLNLSPESQQSIQVLQQTVQDVGREHISKGLQSLGFTNTDLSQPTTIMHEIANKVADTVLDTTLDYLNQPREEQVSESNNKPNSAFNLLTTENQEKFKKVTEKGKEKINTHIEDLARILDPRAEIKNQEILQHNQKQEKIWKNEFIQALDKPTEPFVDRNITEKSVQTFNLPKITQSKFGKAFYETCRFTAQAVRKTPEKIKLFFIKMTTTYIMMRGITDPTKIEKLYRWIDKEYEQIIQDQNSWIYAKEQNFNASFANYTNNLLARFSKLLGEQHQETLGLNITLIDTNTGITTAPKIQIVKDKQSIQSIQVTYKNNSYMIPKDAIQQKDGKIICTIDLTSTSLLHKTIHKVYNQIYTLISDSIISGIRESNLGKSAPEAVDVAEQAVAVNQIPSEGTLVIEYNPFDNSITTRTQRSSISLSKDSNRKVNISVENTYNINDVSVTDQKISIHNDHSNIMIPDITLNVNPLNGNEPIKASITHTIIGADGKPTLHNTATVQEVAKAPDGTYLIHAEFNYPEIQPITPEQKLVKALLSQLPDVTKTIVQAIRQGYVISSLENNYSMIITKDNPSIEQTQEIAIMNASLEKLNTVIQNPNYRAMLHDNINTMIDFIYSAAPVRIEKVLLTYEPKNQEISMKLQNRDTDGKLAIMQDTYSIYQPEV